MFDSLINVTGNINQNTLYLDNCLKLTETKLRDLAVKEKNWIFFTYITGLFNVFTSSFRSIYIRLSEIETALALKSICITSVYY